MTEWSIRLARASEMPGVVGEALFVSDDLEAGLLKQDQTLLAIAMSYKDAVEGYFEGEPAAFLTASPR